MTSASKGRVQRRIAGKSARKIVKDDPSANLPKSIITLTEMPGVPGGFTIGLGLHGARLEELRPGESHPISIVDIIALAVAQVIRAKPPALDEAVAAVAKSIQQVNQQLDDGVPAAEAMQAANTALGGVLSDIEPAGGAPAND